MPLPPPVVTNDGRGPAARRPPCTAPLAFTPPPAALRRARPHRAPPHRQPPAAAARGPATGRPAGWEGEAGRKGEEEGERRGGEEEGEELEKRVREDRSEERRVGHPRRARRGGAIGTGGGYPGGVHWSSLAELYHATVAIHH
uniref:Uncharacterized protein n=1 Tax=Oryza sativa subsp. japonica TaxID=39947 RepID=Q67IU9_ORYSJ|nr:hypothetical protein [Oryza sativa Japonica Group]